MHLHNGRCLNILPPFRFLYLSPEIRLMIHSYAVGYHNVYWTLNYKPRSGFMLALRDLYRTGDRRNIDLHHRPLGLFQSCRSICQETLSVLYNQTRFDIGFHPNGATNDPFRDQYQLQLTAGRTEFADGLAPVVLKRVKHVRVFFEIGSVHPWPSQVLSTCQGRGARLKSLQFTFKESDWTTCSERMWYVMVCLDFALYRSNAVLELLDADPTGENIAKFKERLKGNVFQLPTLYTRFDYSSN
ncbi:hypothetical protein QM012_001734 [Aureobasidium pullulans]|uniref:Uncharacterized protein n=1 Tax=Aureobasidium pullulans TaxID=5580 RepID=A0ABR0TDH9_AURPU